MTSSISPTVIWAVIIGMGVANFLLRFVPIAVVSRMELPAPVMRWLSFVPVSVMGALVAGEVLRPGGQWTNPLASPSVYAAAVTALVFHRTRSFLGATLAGMASFVAIQRLLPLLIG